MASLIGQVDRFFVADTCQQRCRQISEKPGFQQGFAVEPQPPPGQRRIQILKVNILPKQPAPIPTPTSLVHAYASAHA